MPPRPRTRLTRATETASTEVRVAVRSSERSVALCVGSFERLRVRRAHEANGLRIKGTTTQAHFGIARLEGCRGKRASSESSAARRDARRLFVDDPKGRREIRRCAARFLEFTNDAGVLDAQEAAAAARPHAEGRRTPGAPCSGSPPAWPEAQPSAERRMCMIPSASAHSRYCNRSTSPAGGCLPSCSSRGGPRASSTLPRSRGRCSHMSTPGDAVLIALNVAPPSRTPGFGSNVSMCARPAVQPEHDHCSRGGASPSKPAQRPTARRRRVASVPYGFQARGGVAKEVTSARTKRAIYMHQKPRRFSVVEDELARVDQRPEEILEHLAARIAGARSALCPGSESAVGPRGAWLRDRGDRNLRLRPRAGVSTRRAPSVIGLRARRPGDRWSRCGPRRCRAAR